MAARKLKPATAEDPLRLRLVDELLFDALNLAKRAGCTNLANAIRRARKSADGATRHMRRRRQATEPTRSSPPATYEIRVSAIIE